MRFKGPGRVSESVFVGGKKSICTFLRPPLCYPKIIKNSIFDILTVLYLMFHYWRFFWRMSFRGFK